MSMCVFSVHIQFCEASVCQSVFAKEEWSKVRPTSSRGKEEVKMGRKGERRPFPHLRPSWGVHTLPKHFLMPGLLTPVH